MSESWKSADSYYRFMGFDDEALLVRYRPYADLFEGRESVADLGCGTGAFLYLLKQQGIGGTGVDPDPGQVQKCVDKGLDAVVSDAMTYLSKNQGGHDGIFCAHLIEHMAGPEATELIQACHRSLRPGGRAVFVTPNPASLHTQLHEFWRDPTHVRMYSREAIAYLMWSAGFEVVEAADNKLYMTATSYIEGALSAERWWTKALVREVRRRLHQITPVVGLNEGDEIYVVADKKS